MVRTDHKGKISDVNDLKLINRKGIICYGIMAGALTIGFLGDILKQTKEIGLVAVLIALLWITFGACEIVYKNNPKSQWIRFVMLVGFGAFYIVVLLYAYSPMVFLYPFPLLTVATMYRDVRFCLISGITSFLINGAFIVVQRVNGEVTKESITNYEIELVCIIIITVFMVIIAKMTNQLFQAKLDQIKKEKENQAQVLYNVVDVAKTVREKVNEINKEAQQINEQSIKEQNAVEQIASGTSEVANNIQNQLLMSNNITVLTGETSQITEEILSQFNSMKENTQTGSTNMEELMKASKTSQNTCDTVSNSMNELSKKISEVEAILGLIEGVTKQTSMLSLNASIEAARAGDAGRGFAVVASNIQQLSEQTKQATEEIKRIFTKLGDSSEDVVNAVNELEQANDDQTHLITKSKENFEVIEHDIIQITEKVNEQSLYMNKVKASNREISVSIENVSAFTEELTASAEDTKNLTEENLKGIQRAYYNMDAVAAELNKLEGLM